MDKLISLLIGKALMICSGFMVIPFIYSIFRSNHQVTFAFAATILAMLLTSTALIGASQKHSDSLSVYGGAAFLFFAWISIAFFGAAPYYLSNSLTIVSSLMESVSCFTTTGITSITDYIDPSIVLWRSLSQWIGGGMILFFITTVLPAISGCFGVSFALPLSLKTGIISINRINRNAKRVLNIYLIVTLIGIFFFKLSGLSLYDSVNLAMVTISTGGCYVPDTSIQISGWFFIAAVFGLFAAGCNVLLYWQAIKRRQTSMLRDTIKNTETRLFIALILVVGIIISSHLFANGYYSSIDSFTNGFFQVVSFAGTTGIMSDQMLHWPDFDKMLLIMLASIGGCIGSLSGGFKILRIMILIKSSISELLRTIHPDIVLNMSIDGETVPPKLISRILAFFFIITVTVVISVLIISASGTNMQQSMEIALGALTSTGQLMLFHTNHHQILQLPEIIKLFCCFLMILGKIDFFAFLLLAYGSHQYLSNNRW